MHWSSSGITSWVLGLGCSLPLAFESGVCCATSGPPLSLPATWKFCVVAKGKKKKKECRCCESPSTKQQLQLQILSTKNMTILSHWVATADIKMSCPFIKGSTAKKKKKCKDEKKKVNPQLWGPWSLECSCCAGFFSALPLKTVFKPIFLLVVFF